MSLCSNSFRLHSCFLDILVDFPRRTEQAEIPLLYINQHCSKETSTINHGKFCNSISKGITDINVLFSSIKPCESEGLLEEILKTKHFHFNNDRLEYEQLIDGHQISIYLQRLRMNIQKLEVGARKNVQGDEYLGIRRNQANLMRGISGALRDLDEEVIRKSMCQIRGLWKPILLTPNWRDLFTSSNFEGFAQYTSSSSVTNSARFHYIHCYLEARWWLIEYLLRRDIVKLKDQKGKLVLTGTELETELKLWMMDVICLCLAQFSKVFYSPCILEKKNF